MAKSASARDLAELASGKGSAGDAAEAGGAQSVVRKGMKARSKVRQRPSTASVYSAFGRRAG